jgi:hypothetical protein
MKQLKVVTSNEGLSPRNGNHPEVPMGELESALAVWFKQVHASNASIEGNIIRDKALQIAAHLGVDNTY